MIQESTATAIAGNDEQLIMFFFAVITWCISKASISLSHKKLFHIIKKKKSVPQNFSEIIKIFLDSSSLE